MSHGAVAPIRKGVSYKSDGSVCSCIFCNIVKRTEPASIVEESDEFIVFRTIQPAAKGC